MAEYLEPIQLHLPENVEDLKKFAIFGREKLTAIRAEIRAINKIGLSKEVYEQKLSEAQGIAEAVLDAECKMGELMKEVPKATKGTGSNQYQVAEKSGNQQFSKVELLKESGFSEHQQKQYQRLADNPEAVEMAKEMARNERRIVTRADAMNVVKEYDNLKKANEEEIKIDNEKNEIKKSFRRALNLIDWFKNDDFSISAIIKDESKDEIITKIESAITKLNIIKSSVNETEILKIMR